MKAPNHRTADKDSAHTALHQKSAAAGRLAVPQTGPRPPGSANTRAGRFMRMRSLLLFIALGANALATDFSAIHGVDYAAWANWTNYDPQVIERDLGYAKALNVNQLRVFIPYRAYVQDRATFLTNLVHLARACRFNEPALCGEGGDEKSSPARARLREGAQSPRELRGLLTKRVDERKSYRSQ
jgi:hypothetical protein